MNTEIIKDEDYIVVIGHRNPDVDSIVSSILVRNVLRDVGIKSDFAIFKDDYIKKSNFKNINDYIEDEPLVIEEESISDYKYLLVDHNDVAQSIKDENLVIGCIDHHILTCSFASYYKDLGSCSLVIYDLFKEIYNFSEYEKKLIFYSFLSDTNYGRSSRYSEDDKNLIKELGYDTNYDDYFKKYFVETKVTLENFKNNGYKDININGLLFESTYVNAKGSKGVDDYASFIKGSDQNFIGLWSDVENMKTFCFIKLNKKFYEKEYDFIASRAMDVIPYVASLIKI